MNQDPNLKYIALNNFIHLFESNRTHNNYFAYLFDSQQRW